MIEVYTQYSIQQAWGRINEYVNKAFELKLPVLGITDIHSLSGCIEFLQEMAKKNKKSEHKVKPIIGMTVNFKLTNTSTTYSRVNLLAQNLNGYFNLCKLLAKTQQDKETSYVTLLDINLHSDNVIVLSPNDQINELMIHKIKHVWDGNPTYYADPADKIYQTIITCSKHKKTLKEMEEYIDTNTDDPDSIFFDEECSFHLYGDDYPKVMIQTISDNITEFSIEQKPQIPEFTTNADQVLADLCRQGWREKNLNSLDPSIKEVYVTRIKNELNVFTGAKLANYLLIVHDFAKFARDNHVQFGLRGSGAGCLTSHLLGISTVDPLRPDPTLPYIKSRELLFERFYCEARNSPTHISLPDLDCDMPINFRDKLIEYIQNKYTPEKVSYIITFGRLDGKGAIKEVFRVLEPVDHSFDVANEITACMIDTSKVQDILEDIKEEKPDYTIIHYCIDNIPKVANYYAEYKEAFDMAIKLCGCIRNHGRHAAGIVISNKPINEIGPIIYDNETNARILAYEMQDAESAGFVKMDLLGVAAYEKMDQIMAMINNNCNTVTIEG